ncbi:hypothetical protein GX48_05723 [Paracoccidioides brasiliensis]|nr:hypothetical protein GX48_05723 [Paracoccidioides brasiliensis]
MNSNWIYEESGEVQEIEKLCWLVGTKLAVWRVETRLALCIGPRRVSTHCGTIRFPKGGSDEKSAYPEYPGRLHCTTKSSPGGRGGGGDDDDDDDDEADDDDDGEGDMLLSS